MLQVCWVLRGNVSLNAEAQLVVVCVKVLVDFELYLVSLLLKHMDVIFGMDWILSFGVSVNCLTKSITFSKPVAELVGKFLTAKQVKKSLNSEACVFMMFASLKESSEKGISDLPVVQEFPEVFSGRHYRITVGEGSWVCNLFGTRNESYFDCAVS